MKPIVKAPAPKEESPDDVPEERRIAQGRAAVRKAKESLDRTLARAPSSPSLPAVVIPPALDPVEALVAHNRRELGGMRPKQRERAVQALVSLLGEELCR